MKISAGTASTYVWATAASLFVVFALFAGYMLIINKQATPQDMACTNAQQAATGNTTTRLSVDKVLCNGASR